MGALVNSTMQVILLLALSLTLTACEKEEAVGPKVNAENAALDEALTSKDGASLGQTALDDRRIVCVYGVPELRVDHHFAEDGVVATISVGDEKYALRMDQFPDRSAYTVVGKTEDVSLTKWIDGRSAYLVNVPYKRRPISVFLFFSDGSDLSEIAFDIAKRTRACSASD